MLRSFITTALGCLLVAHGLPAQQETQKGKIKKIDAAKGTITLTVGDKDIELTAIEKTRYEEASGAPAKEGLKHAGFKVGASVVFRTAQLDGKTVLSAMKVLGQSRVDFIRSTPPKIDLSKFKPLNEMSPDDEYHGVKGGLYPDCKNERPAKHEALGLSLAKEITPRDKEGKPSADGKIVLLGIGMSNTTQAFSGFMRMAKEDKGIDSHVQLVDGAFGGMTAMLIQNVDGGRSYDNGKFIKYWELVDNRLKEAGVTRAQVQAVWLKEADPGPDVEFQAYAKTLQAEHVKIMHILHDRFPNLKAVYLSSRTFGGWAKTRLNPEPYAYESGFAVKWLIEDQIKGNAALNCDPKQGPVKSPWLCWGPYLWANGTTKRADGFVWEENDFREDDRTHESTQGQDKVGRELVKFFKTDKTTKSWFARSEVKP